MSREAAVTLGLLALAWAAREQAALHDAECSADPAAASRLRGIAAEAGRQRKITANAAIIAARAR